MYISASVCSYPLQDDMDIQGCIHYVFVTPILDVSRKSSTCVILVLDTLKIYNIKTSNEFIYNNTRSYNVKHHNLSKLKSIHP
jgi:hypothetical protein